MTIQTLFKRTPVTMILLLSFFSLFGIQIVTGVDVNEPSTEALIYWGANTLIYTMDNQPWRLLTSAFLHIGFMHLLFNAIAMFYFGQAAEIIFGSSKFLGLFILSAIGGGLLNNYVAWYEIINTGAPLGLSAGASGGIMGIGMSLLILELFKHKTSRSSNQNNPTQLKSLAIIMGINIIYGFIVPGIDNAGHIGGAVTGSVLALGIILSYRYAVACGKPSFEWVSWLVFIGVGLAFYGAWLNLSMLVRQ